MKPFISFFKKQSVLCIAFLAALISAFIVPPDSSYIGYINFSTLILLFCLMGAVAGLNSCGVFSRLSDFLIRKCSNLRTVVFALMNACFFSSMLITNDVALITFVPVTVMIFRSLKLKSSTPLIWAVIIETASANLGSMMLPTGNPQNIFLCSQYGITPPELVKTLLPFGIISYILLSASILMIPKVSCGVSQKNSSDSEFSIKKVLLCSVIFILSLLTVAGILNEYICLAISLALLLISDFRLLSRIDYGLLLTFVFFFIFTGNIGCIDAVSQFLGDVISGNELAVSVLSSQIISNVPAAVLLSSFTDNAKLLLIGTNLGGLGTPVASLASLISYRLYAADKDSDSGKYMAIFLLYNVAFLAVLCISAFIIL